MPATTVSTVTAEAQIKSHTQRFFIVGLEAAEVSFKWNKFFCNITEAARNYRCNYSRVFRMKQNLLLDILIKLG